MPATQWLGHHLESYRKFSLSSPSAALRKRASCSKSSVSSMISRRRACGDSIQIVLADDSVLLREGLACLFTKTRLAVAAQSQRRGAARRNRDDPSGRRARQHPHTPTHTDEGLGAAREIRARHPETGVLVLFQYIRPSYAIELFLLVRD